MAKDWNYWPVYFAAKPLTAKRICLKKGQPFPLQDKFFIRGLARAYGVADTVPFGELPYVAVVNIQTEDMARHIMDHGVELDEARKLAAGSKNG